MEYGLKEICFHIQVPLLLAIQRGIPFAGTYNLPASKVLSAVLNAADLTSLIKGLETYAVQSDELTLQVTAELIERVDEAVLRRKDCAGNPHYSGMKPSESLRYYYPGFAVGGYGSGGYGLSLEDIMAKCVVEAVRDPAFHGLLEVGPPTGPKPMMAGKFVAESE